MLLIRVALDLKASQGGNQMADNKCNRGSGGENRVAGDEKYESCSFASKFGLSIPQIHATFLASTVMIAKPCVGRLRGSERRDSEKILEQ